MLFRSLPLASYAHRDFFKLRMPDNDCVIVACGNPAAELTLNLGYSHPVEIEDPEGVESAVEGQNKIIVKGIDKEKVGQYAAEIRDKRRPEPYKGKGIKYADEVIRRKVGKTGKK